MVKGGHRLISPVKQIVVDYFSRYVEIADMTSSTKPTEVIKAPQNIFARHGLPKELRSSV